MKEKKTRKPRTQCAGKQLLSPSQLMERWRCSRSGVDQIAIHAGLTRHQDSLAKRRNSVRYLLSDVVAYEQSRMKRL